LWFYRRSSRVERSGDGRQWLVMDYQLINAPHALMTVNLPAVSLKSAGRVAPLAVPERTVSIAPLTPRNVFAKGALQELRPDHAPPPLPTDGLERDLEISIAGLLVVLLAWAAWWVWRRFRAQADQPFARALRRIRRIDESDPEAWVEIHRAFDSTAGQALQLASLAVLFVKAPHFAVERAAIEEFFGRSSRRFFADSAAPAGFSPRQLCAALRRIEKRHES
jgi:mxaA protein